MEDDEDIKDIINANCDDERENKLMVVNQKPLKPVEGIRRKTLMKHSK